MRQERRDRQAAATVQQFKHRSSQSLLFSLLIFPTGRDIGRPFKIALIETESNDRRNLME
jgi:hypothetical protein